MLINNNIWGRKIILLLFEMNQQSYKGYYNQDSQPENSEHGYTHTHTYTVLKQLSTHATATVVLKPKPVCLSILLAPCTELLASVTMDPALVIQPCSVFRPVIRHDSWVSYPVLPLQPGCLSCGHVVPERTGTLRPSEGQPKGRRGKKGKREGGPCNIV